MSKTVDPVISDDQRRVARILDLHPDPLSWPMETVNRLVALEKNEGEDALYLEIRKMVTRPNRCPHCGK